MRRLRLPDILAECPFPILTVDPAYHEGPIYPEVGRAGVEQTFIRAVKLHCVDSAGDPASGAVASNIAATDIGAHRSDPQRSGSDLVEDHLANFIARFIPDLVAGRGASGRPVLNRTDYDRPAHASLQMTGHSLQFSVYGHREWPLEFAQQVGHLRDTSVCVATWNADVRRYLQRLRLVDAKVAEALEDRRG